MPEALQAATESGLPKYDAIVVDEAQDFADAYWLPLQYCLDDPEEGVLYVFLDAAQRLYSPESSLIAELPRYELPVNVRNTQAIHRAAAFSGGSGTQAQGPEGRPVEFLALKDGAVLEKEIGKVIHRLVTGEQVPAEDIAVLTGRRPDAVGLDRDSKFAGLPVTPADRPRKGHITLDTVHRFKGLDAPVVVLTGLVVVIHIAQQQAGFGTVDDQADVGADPQGPEMGIAHLVQLVKLQAGLGGVYLEIERRGLHGLLLLIVQLCEAGGEGVGDAEVHYGLINNNGSLSLAKPSARSFCFAF